MKKLIGMSTLLALIAGYAVFANEAKSVVEPAPAPAEQKAEDVVENAVAQPAEDAKPTEDTKPTEETKEEAPTDADETPVLRPEAPAEASETPAVRPNSRYILGLNTMPLPAMVRAQVDIPEGTGLFVEQVKPNGPAAKAEVKQYDVLATVDGVAIANNKQLIDAVQKAAGKPQVLTILRQGKELHLTVTAESVPVATNYGIQIGGPAIQIQVPQADPAFDDDFDSCDDMVQQLMVRQRQQMEQMHKRIEAMEQAMRQNMPGFSPNVPLADPNAPSMLHPQKDSQKDPQKDPQKSQPLNLQQNNSNVQVQQDSFSVQVQKNGNEPAMLKIYDNGNEYQVDENSIDQLPESVRNRLNFKIQTSGN